MFKLRDFFHLPPIEGYFNQIAADQQPGLVLVAGVEAHPAAPAMSSGFYVSSGRNMIFELLYQARLAANPHLYAILVTHSRERARLPSALKGRVRSSVAPGRDAYIHRLENAASQSPELLIIDQLDVENCATILQVAREKQVIAQIDTLLWGDEILILLKEMGAEHHPAGLVTWIVSVQRLAGLCATCKQPAPISPAQQSQLAYRYPGLNNQIDVTQGTFYQPGSCAKCGSSGRSEQIMAFDIYRGQVQNETGAILLPLEEYLYRLAAAGYVPLDDLLHHTGDQLRRMYNLIQHSRFALNDARASLARKTAELEAANLVLLKRTETLITLQDTLQMLAGSNNLAELADRVCRKARDVCGSDRAILYYFHLDVTPPEAEVLAVVGWDSRLLGHRLPAGLLQGRSGERQVTLEVDLPLGGLPPGVKVDTASVLSGMRVPLVSQGQHLGAIILHSTQKQGFTPGEAALLDTFAHQAAIAIQRAGLIDELRARLHELERAQAELVQKERLEHELELAKQVQQSILPRHFPVYAGYGFAAANLPARQVGGDFYDVIRLDDSHFGLLIADVSDKGMPAALFMALTRSLLLAEAHRSLSPKTVLENVHRLLLEAGQTELFVSVFYAVVDARTRRLCYTRAGHERPLLLRGVNIAPLAGNGAVLGILNIDSLNLEEQSIELQPGDRLVLYTDGILDTSNPGEAFFGRERFAHLLQEYQDQPAEEVCTRLFAVLDEFQQTSPQYDDRTLLILDVQAARIN